MLECGACGLSRSIRCDEAHNRESEDAAHKQARVKTHSDQLLAGQTDVDHIGRYRYAEQGFLSEMSSAATLDEVLDHYDAFFRTVARRVPAPNLPPILSSNGLVVDRGVVTADERAALLAYLRKL